MCMFNDDGSARPPVFDAETGENIGPNCDGCGQCGPFEDIED